MELPELGTVFQSKYRLDKVIGEGGFARVYAAEDVGARRLVALKILKPSDDGYGRDTESRFNREVKIIAQLRDPHTVTMFDFGRSEAGLLFMVFEYVPGTDLSELLEARGPLGDEGTIHVLRQVLQSLREAHSAGLLHRDLKPANIRVYEYMGDPLRVTLLDFGIAKTVEPGQEASAITHSGSLVGTPQYMSPEQLLEKQLTPASDIYSLGLVAYEMLTGETAIKGNSLSDQLHILAGASGLCLPPEAPVSPGLRRIVDRMISRDPATRLQTAEHVLRSLDAFVRGEATGDISLEEAQAWHRTGSQPLRAHPNSTVTPPHGMQPLGFPTGSAPLQPPMRDRSSDSMERYAPRPPTTEVSHPIPRRPLPESGGDDSELSTPMLIGLLVVVLCCLGLVISVGLKVLKTEEEPAPRFRVPPSLAVTPPDPAPVKPVTPRPAPKPMPKPEQAPKGCETAGAPFHGPHMMNVSFGLSQAEIYAYIPRNYDPREPNPVLVAFHDVQQTPPQALERFALDKLAEREGLIIVLPHDDALGPWDSREARSGVRDTVLALGDKICIDKQRIYGFGHGAGGRAAMWMPCDFPEVAAIATTAFRTDPGESICLPSTAVPYLHMAAMNDRASPPHGGDGCGAKPALALKAYERQFMASSSCKGKTQQWLKTPAGTCNTWACERAPFVTCHVDGGREWPGPERVVVDPIAHAIIRPQCDRKPAKFPYQETIWKFFEEQSQ